MSDHHQQEPRTLWHKCERPWLPHRDVNGRWLRSVGQVWQRRGLDGRWLYRQDDETLEEWYDRQW